MRLPIDALPTKLFSAVISNSGKSGFQCWLQKFRWNTRAKERKASLFCYYLERFCVANCPTSTPSQSRSPRSKNLRHICTLLPFGR